LVDDLNFLVLADYLHYKLLPLELVLLFFRSAVLSWNMGADSTSLRGAGGDQLLLAAGPTHLSLTRLTLLLVDELHFSGLPLLIFVGILGLHPGN